MTCTRRQFLTCTAAAAAAATTGAAGAGCAPGIEPAPTADVPPPSGGRFSIAVSSYPDLARSGGAITARAPGLDPVLIARTPDGGFVAMSSTCTHRGCPVGFQPYEVVCPCHLSTFDLQGRVTHPPAPQGLTPFATSYDPQRDELTVDLVAGDPGFPRWQAGTVSFPFSGFPQLQSVGGSVAGRPGGAPRPLAILVIALPGPTYAALDAICTHLGCTVGYDAPRGLVICPCHDSHYSADGVVQQGPATRDLERFDVAADTQGVTVQIPA